MTATGAEQVRRVVLEELEGYQDDGRNRGWKR